LSESSLDFNFFYGANIEFSDQIVSGVYFAAPKKSDPLVFWMDGGEKTNCQIASVHHIYIIKNGFEFVSVNFMPSKHGHMTIDGHFGVEHKALSIDHLFGAINEAKNTDWIWDQQIKPSLFPLLEIPQIKSYHKFNYFG